MPQPRHFCLLTGLALLALLGACATGGQPSPMATGAGKGGYKVGSPYEVGGVWYYPKEDFNYDETGIASWYGPGFHGRYTANGEVFDTNELTGAHKTLPMPSLVRVTNLENGRQIVVRINDRGPYAANRIIDLSRRGAQLLGFDIKGTAKVRVQILAEESRELAAAARAGRKVPPPTELADTAGSSGQSSAPVTQASLDSVIASAMAQSPQQNRQQADMVALSDESSDAPPSERQPVFIAGHEAHGHFMPAPVVTQTAVDPAHTRIFVQAGAFSEEGNAENLKDRLAKIAPAAVAPAQVNGRTFYRVRIGPFADVSSADAALSRVISSGQKGARIIVD